MMEAFYFCAIFVVLFNMSSAWGHYNKLIVDCINKPFNNGRYLVNTYYTDTSRELRALPLRGSCKPGTLQVHSFYEQIGYAWIKGESYAWAYFKVTSQQMVNGRYMYETWSYKGRSAFSVSSSIYTRKESLKVPGFPEFARCDGNDGRDRNGYCELTGPVRTQLNTNRIPFTGTAQDIDLKSTTFNTAFRYLTYRGVTAGGAIYGKYWDYRNNYWNSDRCFTFEAHFSDQHSFEVTTPKKDFFLQSHAKYKAEQILRVLGKTPVFVRSTLRTIAINGDGRGAGAGSNRERKSMSLNLADWVIQNAYKLFLQLGAQVELHYIEQSEKWKRAQELDPLFISTYARDNPNSQDVAESFVAWMLVRRYSTSYQSQMIKRTIPNRIAVLDDFICSNNPNFCYW